MPYFVRARSYVLDFGNRNEKGPQERPLCYLPYIFFSPKIIAARRIRKVTFDKSLFKPLTAKEASILQSLADGLGTKEIAAMHGTSEQTIKNFVYRSCQKTGCDNRVHLVAQAIRRGIVR